MQRSRYGQAVLPLKPPGQDVSLPLPSPDVTGHPRGPWLVAVSLQPLPLSSHGLSVCVSECLHPSLLTGHVSLD